MRPASRTFFALADQALCYALAHAAAAASDEGALKIEVPGHGVVRTLHYPSVAVSIQVRADNIQYRYRRETS